MGKGQERGEDEDEAGVGGFLAASGRKHNVISPKTRFPYGISRMAFS